MSRNPTSTKPLQRHWTSRVRFATGSDRWPIITAESLRLVREPFSLKLEGAVRADTGTLVPILHRAARGPWLDNWNPPSWLYPHQVSAARRLAGTLASFRGALLADAVGLGKTYVSLAIATRYRRPIAVVPAALIAQWARTARGCGIRLPVVSHEALSRGRRIAPVDLVIVDEAHRFRNPLTRRYDRLARDIRNAHTLLVSATPVVNSPKDLIALLRLFLPDHGLALLGLPSLERAIAVDDHAAIVSAVASLLVARSPQSTSLRDLPPMPRVVDGPIDRVPTLVPSLIQRVARGIERLEFPSFGTSPASHLLRAHLYHRLGSSAAALRQTLRRHLAYLDRAEVAAGSGTGLSRRQSRALFGTGDDLQLELAMLPRGPVADTPTEDLLRERERVLELMQLLPTGAYEDPKRQRLERLLTGRRSQKTIVFVNAASTALDLARRLHWREIAVVAGGRAWIASGPTRVDDALSLFAPRARRAAEPSRTARVSVLIATDFVSEGLDLQDADGVVHFDLPWSPLRLAQRLGRVVRLGSSHTRTFVHWFAPPPPVERRLLSELRLARKAVSQLRLGVPTTSTVGHAQVLSALVDARESIPGVPIAERLPKRPLVGVVDGRPAIVAAVTWWFGTGPISELVALTGSPLAPVADPGKRQALVKACERAAPIDGVAPPRFDPLFDLLRARIRATEILPCDHATVALRRRILQLAAQAAQGRQLRLVGVLDRVLSRLNRGLSEGAVRDLRDRLQLRSPRRALSLWLDRWPVDASVITPRCAIHAVIVRRSVGP